MVLFQEDDESVTFNRTVTCKSVTFKQDIATVFAGRSLFDRPVSLERRCDGHFSIGRSFFRKTTSRSLSETLSIGRSLLDRTVTLARRRFYGPRRAGLFGETVRTAFSGPSASAREAMSAVGKRVQDRQGCRRSYRSEVGPRRVRVLDKTAQVAQ